MGWTRRFVRFHDLRHPTELHESDVKAFLVHLAEDRHLAPSRLAPALAALIFLYKDVLGQPLAGLGAMPRARAPVKLPAVLTPEEVHSVLSQLRGTTRLIGILLYGSGMRLMECLMLRVKDLDIERGEICIRRGKGAKDRVTVLPSMLRSAMVGQVDAVRQLHTQDCSAGADTGWLPGRSTGSIRRPGGHCRGSGCSRRGGDTWTR